MEKKEEEMIDRMLKAVVTEAEEPTLPAVRRKMSKQFRPPSMSGGEQSETGSSFYQSPAKVSDWLLKRHPGPIASSSGYDTMSEATSQVDPDVTSMTDTGALCLTWNHRHLFYKGKYVRLQNNYL